MIATSGFLTAPASRVHQIRFWPGAKPRTPLGELTTLSRPPSRLGRGKPPPTSHLLDAFSPLDAFGVSIRRLWRTPSGYAAGPTPAIFLHTRPCYYCVKTNKDRPICCQRQKCLAESPVSGKSLC